MAEDVVGAISDLLECAICHCRFQNAKCLGCMHTFCKGCLDRLIGTAVEDDDDYDDYIYGIDDVRCPICREQTNCGRGGANLKTNLLANKIIDELKRYDKLNKTDEKFCKEHGAENKFFCEKCGVVICSECALCNHGKHTFLIRNVEDASKAKVDEIVKLMGKATIWMESHEEFRSNYEVKREEGNEQLDDIVYKIEISSSTCKELVTDQIDLKEKELLSEVESHRRDLNEALDNILVPVNEAISQVSDEIECAEEMLDSSEPKEVVLKYRDWAKRLLRGIDKRIPSDVTARRRVACVESLQFHESKMPVPEVPKLGVIRQQASDKTDQAMGSGFLKRPRQRLLLTVRLQLSGRIKMMVPYTNGSILVRYGYDHMEVLHPDGSDEKISAQYIAARDMAVLSDGRFVALTKTNLVKMYGKGGESHQIEFVTCQDDEIADAIATDAEDHILLLYAGAASIMRFSPEGGEPIDVIRINDIKFKEVLKMSSTVMGKIVIVQPDEVLVVCSKEGILCQKIPIQRTDRVSCDQEGKLWMISNQDIQGTKRNFLEVYAGENGERIADTYLPNDSATPGFEPWGVAASTSCFAALISPNEVGWFVCQL